MGGGGGGGSGGGMGENLKISILFSDPPQNI